MKSLDELERIARAATQGEWRECGAKRGGCSCGLVWSKDLDFPVANADAGDEEVGHTDPEVIKANAAHIAAMSPDTTLKLIADARRLDWLERHFTRLSGVYVDAGHTVRPFEVDCEEDTFSDQTNRLRAAIDAALSATERKT